MAYRSAFLVVCMLLVSCGKQPSAANSKQPPQLDAEIASRCAAAMEPFVNGNAEILLIALAQERGGHKRFNKDNPFHEREILASLYEMVRFQGLVAAASEFKGGTGFRAGLSEKETDILLAVSVRASAAITNRICNLATANESNQVQQVVESFGGAHGLPRSWSNSEAPNELAIEIGLGKEEAKRMNENPDGGLFSTTRLALRRIIGTEIEACSLGITNAPGGEPWGVSDLLRKRRLERSAKEWPVFVMAVNRCVAPETAKAMREASNKYKIDEHFILQFKEVDETARKKPDIQVTIRPGASVEHDISFTHTSSIVTRAMTCTSADSAPSFLETQVKFGGCEKSRVRLTMHLKAQTNAPVGPHYFRLLHQGEYDDGKIHKERVVRVNVEPVQ